MATVVGSPPVRIEALASPSASGRLQSYDVESQGEPSRSRSERLSRDGDEKDELSEAHRESLGDERDAASHDELRPSEVLRVGSEIDSFVNRNRQASVAHLKLRPQASHAHLPVEHTPELYDVVTHAVIRKNSLLGSHSLQEGKQLPLGDEWAEPFISGDHQATGTQINVARLSMSVAQAKAKLDGTASKVLSKNQQHQEDNIGLAPVVVEPGTEVLKPLSPRGGVTTTAPSGAPPKQMDEAESVALNKQRQASAIPQRKEQMTGPKPDNKQQQDEDDADGSRVVRILLPARYAPAEIAVPPPPSKVALKPILKPSPIPCNGLATLLRQEAYIASIMDRMKVAAKFMKYNLQGKPNSRYFYITEDGTELHWTKTNPAKGRNKQAFIAEKPRKRFFADVRGVYYGPYNNRRVFRRFLDNKDHFEGSGKDWLCITVAFDDRTLDFCCTTDEQVSTWFLCMQALAPLAASYLTCGSVLWRRLIMKLNSYGLNPERWPGPLQDRPQTKGKKK